MRWFDHIEERREVLGGKPVIKGTRISIELILERLSDGWTEADLLGNYPSLTVERIRAALRYASIAAGLHADVVFEAIGFEYGLDAGRPKIPTAETPPA